MKWVVTHVKDGEKMLESNDIPAVIHDWVQYKYKWASYEKIKPNEFRTVIIAINGQITYYKEYLHIHKFINGPYQNPYYGTTIEYSNPELFTILDDKLIILKEEEKKFNKKYNRSLFRKLLNLIGLG